MRKMRPRVQYLLNCYSGENLILEISENGERSFDPGESVSHVRQPQMADVLIPVFAIPNANNVRNVELGLAQRQTIRNLARTLKNTADNLLIGPPRSALLTIEQEILANENLNKDEMLVVKNILSENSPISVSNVAEHLRQYMSSRTFRAALRYLCYSAASAPEELIIACELVKAAYPTIRQLSRADSVCEVINEFIDEKLNEVLH